MGRSFLAHAHFFIRAYGQTLKSATTSYFWKQLSTFFSSLILQLQEFVTQLINTCQDEIYITLQMISQMRIFFQSRVRTPKQALETFRSKLRGIVPSASRDNSTNASNFTSFVFSESHYNLPISTCDLQVIRFAFGIGVSQ